MLWKTLAWNGVTLPTTMSRSTTGNYKITFIIAKIRIIQINKHRVDDTVFLTVNIEESIINISDIVAALTALKSVEQVKNSQVGLDIGKY